MISNSIKTPDTNHDVHPLIQKRWSPRAFSDKVISEKQVQELFEASRWAASAYNEQPWMYAYSLRGMPGFKRLWQCLLPGNQTWAQSAAVLLVAMYRKRFSRNDKRNPWAAHDLGMANAQLLLQAVDRGIYGHLMAGFDREKIKQLLNLNSSIEPLCMGALGYLGSPDDLKEPYKTQELRPRKRREIQTFVKII